MFNEALAAVAATLTEMAGLWLASMVSLPLSRGFRRGAVIAAILYYASQIIELVSEAMSLWGKAKDRAAGVVGLVRAVEFGRLRDVKPPRMLLSPGSPL
ncbi:hypothetical protein AB0E59_16895 [Lentzea sp. NPDC034063]|uniref:hypothetical protein n=1 Tax=unclassified Lentzea TaxID=2643253 RepID=UPI0033CA2C0C